MEPIAIVGMAIRLPGDINSPQDLWEFLLAGKDARGPSPPSRYDATAFFDKSGKPGSAPVHVGYFLDRNVEQFDRSAFPMSSAEIESLDPQQRQLLEVVRDCLDGRAFSGEACMPVRPRVYGKAPPPRRRGRQTL